MVAEHQKEKDEKRKLEESIKTENSKNAKCFQDTVTLCIQQESKIQNLTKEKLHLSDENKRLKTELEKTKAEFQIMHFDGFQPETFRSRDQNFETLLKKEIAAKIERDNQTMKTVLDEYTRMSNQNKNLTLENKSLTKKQNSMKSIAEQGRLLMEAIGLPAIEGNSNVSPPLEPPPSAAPPRKRQKTGTPKAKKDTIENTTAHSSTKLPKLKNKPKNDDTAKKSKKRSRSNSNENPPGTTKQTGNSSSYWDTYGNIFAPGSSRGPSQQNDQKSKTNEAFENTAYEGKKRFGKWNEAGDSD